MLKRKFYPVGGHYNRLKTYLSRTFLKHSSEFVFARCFSAGYKPKDRRLETLNGALTGYAAGLVWVGPDRKGSFYGR